MTGASDDGEMGQAGGFRQESTAEYYACNVSQLRMSLNCMIPLLAGFGPMSMGNLHPAGNSLLTKK
jgi:hypothetical protein